MITNSVDEAILLSDRIVALGHGPGASLSAPVAVTLDRPRAADLMMHDEAAVWIRAQVSEFLTSRGAANRAAQRALASAVAVEA
jgi:ABC-type nitrate/sulfonate/bicarbonate transport system ATPase subunit